jgi:hypothetical protein
MLRTVKGPDSRLHPVALLENEEAIQASIMEVVNGLIRGTIELRRGELILRALNAAVRSARRVQFGIHSRDMVKQVPEYDDQPSPETTQAVDPTQPKPPTSDRSAQVLHSRKERAPSG